MAYADCLSKMYYATAPREVEKALPKNSKQKYIELGIQALQQNNASAFL